MNQVTLPDKPSELLAIALEDLELCEKDPVYEIDMSTYHSPSEETGRCAVCLAGSVLAQRMRVSPKTDWEKIEMDDSEILKLKAIDRLRIGNLLIAGRYLGLSIPLSNRQMPPYSPNFKPAIRQLITDLTKVGC